MKFIIKRKSKFKKSIKKLTSKIIKESNKSTLLITPSKTYPKLSKIKS